MKPSLRILGRRRQGRGDAQGERVPERVHRRRDEGAPRLRVEVAPVRAEEREERGRRRGAVPGAEAGGGAEHGGDVGEARAPAGLEEPALEDQGLAERRRDQAVEELRRRGEPRRVEGQGARRRAQRQGHEDGLEDGHARADGDGGPPGQDKSANLPTLEARISVVLRSFRLFFGRAITSRSALDAWILSLERSRAAPSR